MQLCGRYERGYSKERWQKCDELQKLFNLCKIFHFTEACTVILYTRGHRGSTWNDDIEQGDGYTLPRKTSTLSVSGSVCV